jgi:diadenosine tetraphosphate (Ap4A) HIT family hydrolase
VYDTAAVDAACPFCTLVAALAAADTAPGPAPGDPPARKVADLSASVAVLGGDQLYRGYTVVIARTHATELFQLPEAESVQYYRDMVRVARAVSTAFGPRKLNYECLGNTVPHLHWHVLPRYADDPNPLRPIWERSRPPRPPSPEEAAATIAALRRAL